MNQNLSCIIVDDDPVGIQLIEAFLSKIPYLEHQASFKDPIAALDFLKTHHSDILITDIQMPGLTGLEMVQSIPMPPEIIFTTAHRNFAVEGFDLNAVDYLLKPLNFARFKIAINRVIDRLQVRSRTHSYKNDFLFVKQNRIQLKILFGEITYIEARGDFVRIYKTNHSNIIARSKMSEMENILPKDKFLRVHKSFIVNSDEVHSIGPDGLIMKAWGEVPLAKSLRGQVIKRLGL